MNILLIGASGQLGTELLPLLAKKGRVTPTDRSPPGASQPHWVQMDIADSSAVERLLNQQRPSLIVNAAAYTAVDQAEVDQSVAHDVNARFPGQLAHWANKNDALLIHYSTDYVFNGNASAPYLESDKPDPQNVYGESKLAGEKAISASGCKYTTLRTSWVYSSHGKNFVLSMLNLARRGIPLSVVDDQRGCPTWAGSLARASDKVIEHWHNEESGRYRGVFHYCDDRQLSWYEFADAVFKSAVSAGLLDQLPELKPIPSVDFPQPASRPSWSVLDTGKIEEIFNIQSAAFEESLTTVIKEVLRKEQS